MPGIIVLAVTMFWPCVLSTASSNGCIISINSLRMLRLILEFVYFCYCVQFFLGDGEAANVLEGMRRP